MIIHKYVQICGIVKRELFLITLYKDFDSIKKVYI